MDMETEELPPDAVVVDTSLEPHPDDHMIFSEAQLAESLCETQTITMDDDSVQIPIEMIVTHPLGDEQPHQEIHHNVMEHCHSQPEVSDVVTSVTTEELPLDNMHEQGQLLQESLSAPALEAPGAEEEVESEPSCSCLTCQKADNKVEEDGTVDKTKIIKCLVCYALINSAVPHEKSLVKKGSNVDSASTETKPSISSNPESRIDRGDSESQNLTEQNSAANASIGSVSEGDTSVGFNSQNVLSSCISMGDAESENKSGRSLKYSRISISSEEEPQIKLSTIFHILKCSLEEIDQKDMEGFLTVVPLCAACHSVVSDAVLIYKEIEKLDKTLGNLRETIKDLIVKSFEANFCKRKKDSEDAIGILGQIDATRRAILSEGVSAAQILSSFKGSKRGGAKRKKTIVSKSALYPHVTLEPVSDRRGKGRKITKTKAKVTFDESGVKQECSSDQDDNQRGYGYEDDEFPDDDEEEEQVTFLQTHSGRVVKRPNYKKWLLAEEDDEEEELKPEGEIEGGESPKSEPEWSPGHTDDEAADEDFDSDSDTSVDSEVDLDSEDELDDDKKILDEFGELLGHGEEYIDPDTGEKLIRTVKKRKQGNRVKCTECSRTFADEAKRETHMKRKHQPGGNTQTYDCDKCSKTFRRPGLLRKHLEKQHGEVPEGGSSGEQGDKKRHMCDFCGQKYRNASELRIHVRLHTGETPYKCEHCDKSFVSSLKREFHIEQCHWEVPPLKCEFCTKAFFRQHRLRIHRISHTGEKAYLCEICSQSFSHPTYLKYHQGQHAELNLETFKCNDCGKVFANPTNLRLHTKTVHLKQFRFHCEVCNMGFTHMSHKRIHMRGHTGERPYNCELCNESFRYRDRLRIHMRGHTGERPFVCEMCKKGFASRSKLKRHEKIHEKNQPSRPQTEQEIGQTMRHGCDDCGKRFAEPQHLSAHRRYCQRKALGLDTKEERKPSKASQSSKMRATAAAAVVPKVEQIPIHQPQQPPQPTQMLVPIPVNVNYSYPVTYAYEVPQPYHPQQQPGTREYNNYN